MACLTALFARTTVALRMRFVVEQPQTNLLFKYPPMARALAAVAAVTVAFKMEVFNGESPKPWSLNGSGILLDVFRVVASKRAPTRTTGRLMHSKRVPYRRVRCSGKLDELTASNGYTRCMGVAMAFGFCKAFCGHHPHEIARHGVLIVFVAMTDSVTKSE